MEHSFKWPHLQIKEESYMTTSNIDKTDAAHTSHEKNTCIKGDTRGIRVKTAFSMDDWCHENDTRYTVETCEHEVEFEDGAKENRKATYNMANVFEKIDGSRRSVTDAFDLMMTLFEDATVGGDAKAAMLANGMRQLNTTVKNNVRRSLQVKVSKKVVREAMQEYIGKLINSIGDAAAEGDMEKVQELTQQLKTAQVELSAL